MLYNNGKITDVKNRKGEKQMSTLTLGGFWIIFNLILIGIPFCLCIYALILAIKALKIYINKNKE